MRFCHYGVVAGISLLILEIFTPRLGGGRLRFRLF